MLDKITRKDIRRATRGKPEKNEKDGAKSNGIGKFDVKLRDILGIPISERPRRATNLKFTRLTFTLLACIHIYCSHNVAEHISEITETLMRFKKTVFVERDQEQVVSKLYKYKIKLRKYNKSQILGITNLFFFLQLFCKITTFYIRISPSY